MNEELVTAVNEDAKDSDIRRQQQNILSGPMWRLGVEKIFMLTVSEAAQ